MKTTVLIIEDDLEFGRALRTLIETAPLLAVAGIVTTLADAQHHVHNTENDIYLVDITLSDGSGIDIMRTIRAHYPKSKILALSTLGDERHIFSSIAAGASGYLLKSEMPANIIQSIISLINDGGYLSGHASKVLIDKLIGMDAHAATASQSDAVRGTVKMNAAPIKNRSTVLTPKEFEILTMVEQGSPAKVIADALAISIFTVNQHLRSIYRKLNVRNKMEAVQAARRQGLL